MYLIRMTRKPGEVDPVDDPVHAIAAPDAPHRVDIRRRQGRIEVGKAVVIAAGEIAIGLARVGSQVRFIAHRGTELGGARAVVALEQWPRWGNQGNASARTQARREDLLGYHRCSDYD